jgi:putative addiction module killer protein
MIVFEILHYTSSGRDFTTEWLRKLKDIRAKASILRRINRMETGNFGDHKPCREGVWELRIDVGPGYRVYYAIAGKTLIVLLCGSDKHTQDADIAKACEYWRDWQVRNQD